MSSSFAKNFGNLKNFSFFKAVLRSVGALFILGQQQIDKTHW